MGSTRANVYPCVGTEPSPVDTGRSNRIMKEKVNKNLASFGSGACQSLRPASHNTKVFLISFMFLAH